MSFHINKLPFQTTLARQIARQHLTRFNDVYWVAERGHKHNRAAFPAITFPKPAPGVHGIFESAVRWETAADQHHQWVRQHILVSAASLLEVYVKSASVSAVSARPEVIDKSYTGIDGFSFVKAGKNPKPLRDLIDNVTAGFIIGLWEDRFRRLARVFGKLPQSLLDCSAALQTLQTKRNRIAHEFGNNGKGRKAPWDAFEILEIGPSDVRKAITSVSEAIASLDKEVFGPTIGSHEILQQFHIWKSQQPNYQRLYVSGRLVQEFRSHLGKKFGASPATSYLKGMVDYYEKI